MKVRILCLIFAGCCFASLTQGDTTIETYSSTNPTSVTTGWSGGAAQTFQSISECPLLVSWHFTIAPRLEPTTPVTFSIYSWLGDAPTGSALYTTSVPWPPAGGDIVLSGINVLLPESGLYAAVIDFHRSSFNSVYYTDDAYPGGNGFWADNVNEPWRSVGGIYDLQFQAQFVAVPEPSTLSLTIFILSSFFILRVLLKNRLIPSTSRIPSVCIAGRGG